MSMMKVMAMVPAVPIVWSHDHDCRRCVIRSRVINDRRWRIGRRRVIGDRRTVNNRWAIDDRRAVDDGAADRDRYPDARMLGETQCRHGGGTQYRSGENEGFQFHGDLL